MDRYQHFRRWMYINSEEYGRMTSEYDYTSYSKGWDHAIQAVREAIEKENFYCKEPCRFNLSKALDKL